MHDVPYGLALWLGGLILLILFVLYVLPWLKSRLKRSAPPPLGRTDELDTDGPSSLPRSGL